MLVLFFNIQLLQTMFEGLHHSLCLAGPRRCFAGKQLLIDRPLCSLSSHKGKHHNEQDQATLLTTLCLHEVK